MYTLNTFVKHNIPYDWATIYVGRKLRFLKPEAIERYAIKYLEAHPQCLDPYIAELAYGVQEGEIDSVLNTALKNIQYISIEKDGPRWNLEKRKWRYVIMNELFAVIHDSYRYSQLLRTIYADFGYPEDMWDFLYNVSSTQYSHSLEENVKIERERLNKFLQQERILIDKQDATWPDSGIYYPLD